VTQKSSHKWWNGAAVALLASSTAEKRLPELPENTGTEAWMGGLLMSRILVIATCCLVIVQYALIQVFGVYSTELFTPSQANQLYAAENWGACALAAPAGLVLDILGPARSTLLGGLASAGGLTIAALALSHGVADSLWQASLGYLVFGWGSTLLNTVSVLCAVRAAPKRNAGRTSAGVLCILALGLSFHTAVHIRWFEGRPFQFFGYQILYSISVALVGTVVFSSPAWKRACNQQELDGTEDAASNSGVTARLQRVLAVPDFRWLSVLHMIPIAYSFALFGCWSVCAGCLGIQEDIAHVALSMGMMSAFGRAALGSLADWSPNGCKLGLELGIVASLCSFQLGFGLLERGQRSFFENAVLLQSFGYGGLLALVPVVLRNSFLTQDMGSAYGLLYQFLAFTFTLFNRAAVPVPGCTGPECFKIWFRTAAVLNAFCLAWAVVRCIRRQMPTRSDSLNSVQAG